ncbi:MAG: MCE family protein [Pseudonocardiaceae bacterium]
MTSTPHRALVILMVAALAAAGLFLVLRPGDQVVVHAEFAQADGMFVGSDVGILGVKLGRVDRLEPRGDHVRITMSLPPGTKVPVNAEAWVMSPSVVSDQYIELTPAYRSGATLPNDAVIPLDRTHSPVKWDKLVGSVNDLLVTFGPDGANSDGDIGGLLKKFAAMVDGKGETFRRSILNITQASEVVKGEMPNIESLVTSLDALVKVLADNKSTVDSLTASVDAAASEFAAQDRNIAVAIASLSTVMDQVGQLARKHGDSMTGSLDRLAEVSVELAEHQNELVEIVDVLPLAADNVDRAVTPDGKLRIRFDISSNLESNNLTRRLCQQLPLPLCSGAGITNPIPVPLDLGGPLGGGN